MTKFVISRNGDGSKRLVYFNRDNLPQYVIDELCDWMEDERKLTKADEGYLNNLDEMYPLIKGTGPLTHPLPKGYKYNDNQEVEVDEDDAIVNRVTDLVIGEFMDCDYNGYIVNQVIRNIIEQIDKVRDEEYKIANDKLSDIDACNEGLSVILRNYLEK